MKKFTIEKSNCPFEFFSEIGFEHKPFVISLIQQKFVDYSQSECEEVYERNCDEIDDKLCCEDLHFFVKQIEAKKAKIFAYFSSERKAKMKRYGREKFFSREKGLQADIELNSISTQLWISIATNFTFICSGY